MSMPAIEIQGVTKAFRHRERQSGAPLWRRAWKEKVALHELDLNIDAHTRRGRRRGWVGSRRLLALHGDVNVQPMKALSRGQEQKVAIARRFLTESSLLLMDKRRSGLDPRSKKEVQAVRETL